MLFTQKYRQKFIKLQQKDPLCLHAKRRLENGSNKYRVINGIICRRHRIQANTKFTPILPQGAEIDIFPKIHVQPGHVHLTEYETFLEVSKYFHVKIHMIREYVNNFCKDCKSFQIHKQKYRGVVYIKH